MTLRTQPYFSQREMWPRTGRHILAQYDGESIIVYQAYNPSIGHFAAQHGFFGGDFKATRMSWVKPNFLWMMYRSGWGTKPNQEVTLAIRMRLSFWEEILATAVPSSFKSEEFENREVWQKAVEGSAVRLQWDPDHDPHGAKMERRAIQLGLRGEMLRRFSRDDVLGIEDISSWVEAQRVHVQSGQLEKLALPAEQVYDPQNPLTVERLGLRGS